jgi:hypothetical protein
MEDFIKGHSESEEELIRKIEREKKEIHQLEEVLGDEVSELHDLEEKLEDLKRHHPPHEPLHIFVNGLRYGMEDGVKPVMSGAEIVELVPIDPQNADLTREGSDKELSMVEPIELCNAERFEAIRKTVNAG